MKESSLSSSNVSGPMVVRKAKTKQSEASTKYQPNDREKVVIDRVRQRMRERKTFDRIKIDKSANGAISPDHADVMTGMMLQMDALGLSSYDGYAWFLGSFANAITKGRDVKEVELNGALTFVKAMQPRDDMEALLLAQMAATHNLTMTFARKLNHVDNIKQQDSASNAYNKLARTFAAQMQTLKQYRSNGQQVIVQRVDVREGGQAIVGNIANSPTGGRGDEKNGGQPHALADTRGSAMLCKVEEKRATVPRASGPGQESLPDARSLRGRS
jgi:hypothetical protein